MHTIPKMLSLATLQHALGPSQSCRQPTGVLPGVRVLDIQLRKGFAAVGSDNAGEHNQAAPAVPCIGSMCARFPPRSSSPGGAVP